MAKYMVLSVQQPWADYIVYGSTVGVWKWCENRTWTTPYRGQLLIHASSQAGHAPAWMLREYPPAGTGRVGVILGSVNLIDVVPLARLEDSRYTRDVIRPASGLRGKRLDMSYDFAEGPECFILSDPVPFAEPIPASGRLRLWTIQLNL